ncbi:MAG: hypothetical protein U0L22_06330 [Bacteroidales bacterium]|nr:hypothetical protein [Bacteroidales bacterium]MEE1143228.1 hypothetical protein [Bacteroidales bacterium]
MKKRFVVLVVLMMSFVLSFAQNNNKDLYPFYIGKDYVVVGVSAKTTDKELLEIRKNILKYSSIRFNEFDVIRGENGDIYFLSIKVDCRDGYSAYISHSFEKGDTTIHGFIRDYTKTHFNRAFYYGDLTDETSGIERIKQALAEKEEEK